MANQYVNKVIYGGTTLIDISADTVTADKLAYGYKAHDKSGAQITGTNTYDADTSDATASQDEILSTKTAYVNGVKLTGNMPNRGAVTGSIETFAAGYTIPQGYHDGSGTVNLNYDDLAKVTNPANIKAGVEIGGVTGTYSGEAISVQSRTATPSTTQQVITPQSGYDYLSQVTVLAIPYVETDNAAGGKTVTIG
jgi:hypothetical protein